MVTMSFLFKYVPKCLHVGLMTICVLKQRQHQVVSQCVPKVTLVAPEGRLQESQRTRNDTRANEREHGIDDEVLA